MNFLNNNSLVFWLCGWKSLLKRGRVLCGCGVTLWNIHRHEADKPSDIFVEFDWSLDSIFSITVGSFLSVCVWQPQRILFFFWYTDFVTWNDSHFLYILFREIKKSKGRLSQQNVGFHGCFNSRGTWNLKVEVTYWCLSHLNTFYPFLSSSKRIRWEFY